MHKIIIVCGHYGSGKTNYAVNLAIELAKEGSRVTLADVDVVNPYFRSADHRELLENYGIKLIVPKYANTNVDIPVLPEEMQMVFAGEGIFILDVGGDDAGAVVLGRYFSQFKDVEYEMRYVINKYRNLIAEPEEAYECLKEIETSSRLKITSIVNNSHLKYLTTGETIEEAIEYGKKVSELSGLPLTETTYPSFVKDEIASSKKIKAFEEETGKKLKAVDIYVKTVWE